MKFWNIRNVLSRQALFNFIISFRGGGKTFGSKVFAIENFINKGEQFIYVRRYETDLSKSKREFLTDILIKRPDLFKNHDIKITGDKLFVDGKTAGFFIPLSKASSFKSVAFPDVTLIIYDEFLIDKSSFQRYIPNEPQKFLDFYSTVARPGTGHKRVLVFFLANAISLLNPYFTAFKISLPYKKQIKLFANNQILVEIFESPQLQKEQEMSDFGQIVKLTNPEYFNYAFSGEFKDNNKEFIKHKTIDYVYYFTIVYKKKKFGVWISDNKQDIIISNDIDDSCPLIIAGSKDDMQTDYLLINKCKKSIHLRNLLDCYYSGSLFYETVNTKNLIIELLETL